MAFTTSTLMNQVALGNQKCIAMNVTADAAEGNITTGLSVITFGQISPVSAPTGPSMRINANSTATVSNGTVGLSNCTSGNIYMLVVYGR